MISPRKVLFIQLRRIGDVLMCTPAIRAFKKRYSECTVDFLTEHPDVLSGNPRIDSIIPVDPSKQFHPAYQYRLISEIAKNRYDLVVDFLANPRSAYYSFLTGAKVRLSYGYGHRKWAYNLSQPRPSQPVYAALDKLNLMKAVDVYSEDTALEFYPSDKDCAEADSILKDLQGNKFVTVSPVSRREYRRWPLQRFADICRGLNLDYNFKIVILVGPGEEEFGRYLSDMLKDINPLLAQVNRLGLLGATFEKSTLHIGNDNGPKHIAVARGTPTFTIFGSDNPVSWTYPDYSGHRFISSRDIDPECRAPSHKCGPECINKISSDAVYGKLTEFISFLSVTSGAPEPK